MFLKADEAIKVLAESFYNFRSAISIQTERMNSRVMELRVERTVINAENVAVEINDLNFKDEFLGYFAHETQRIKHMLHEEIQAFVNSRNEKSVSVKEQTPHHTEGWLGRMLGRQKQIVQTEPELNDFRLEEYKSNYENRNEIISSLIAEVEAIVTDLKSSLNKWSFHFKERVVCLSKEGYENNLGEISLYESLVSIFSHHAVKYPGKTFSISQFFESEGDPGKDLEDEIGMALSQTLQETFLD